MRLNPLFPSTDTLGINTDLYELTMAAAYFEAGCIEDRATFELFTQKLPPTRSFLIAAGLEQALHFIENLRFTEETLQYLRKLEAFQCVGDAFFDYLRSFKFTGDIEALPEGTVFFGNEPIMQITAPIIEAQIVETYLINSINFQTMVASKATRISLAGEDRPIIDFGSRRAHSPQAGVLAARAAFIGGCKGTSNVLAGYEMGIPVYGTMAHSFVQFFDQEVEAFQRFHDTFGQDSTILVDTYDTLAGVKKALNLKGGIQAVRLDSGDLLTLAIKTRELLDQQGHPQVRIVASGDLNEEKIRAMADAPIDGYGVGTELVVSTDAPTCNLVYKLVEVTKEGGIQPRMKTSQGKATVPCRKRIFRRIKAGNFCGDLLCGYSESPPEDQGEVVPLLQKYVGNGQMISELPNVFQIREYTQQQLSKLPPALKLLHTRQEYPVEYSRQLREIQKELEKELA